MVSQNCLRVLFDLDGVLVDSLANMKLFLERLPKNLRAGVGLEAFRGAIGLTFREALNQLGVIREKDALVALFKQNLIIGAGSVKTFDGVSLS